MASLPPSRPSTDPHNLSQAAHIQQATQKVNRFAKRDPALYPLSAIVIGALGIAGYFLVGKASETEPHRQLMANGVVNPWDDSKTHGTHPSSVAAFKYRHRERDGTIVDSLPALNSETRNVSSSTPVDNTSIQLRDGANQSIPHVGSRTLREIEEDEDDDDDVGVDGYRTGDLFGFRFEWPH